MTIARASSWTTLEDNPAAKTNGRCPTPMAVTRSWEAKVLAPAPAARRGVARLRRMDLAWLAAASVMVSAGLALVYSPRRRTSATLASQLDRGELLDLNALTKPEQLLPFLQMFSDPASANSRPRRSTTTWPRIRRFRTLARWRGCG